ncbi:MAG TPA: efflux RND transporter periplasmic adaptor subunit, partial [Hyphomicrobiaceae bacterium]|nr:efflux RND transporter periplasmic adaptor subunit [Hyphomicrobiaceae bacterium]
QQSGATAPVVTVAAANREPFVDSAFVTGTVVPREEILVSPEISGQRILEVLVQEGDTVSKDQVLARLVTGNLDAQIAQNQAAQARATAAIAQARSRIEQARATLEQTEAALTRAKPLKRDGYLAQSTFDDRQAAARTARAQLTSAMDGLLVAEADKAQSEAQYRELAWRHSNTDVTAPTTGIISRRSARIGAQTSANEPLFRIIQNGDVELLGELTSAELAKVRDGQSAAIDVAGHGQVSGTIRLVSPEVDRTTRLGTVRIRLPAKSGIRIGAFGRGRIITARSTGISIPRSAVMYDVNQPYILAASSGIVKRHNIVLGLQDAERVEVLRGLVEGTHVVTKAGTFLREGDAVTPQLVEPSKLSEAR